jgi:hypothetical protein
MLDICVQFRYTVEVFTWRYKGKIRSISKCNHSPGLRSPFNSHTHNLDGRKGVRIMKFQGEAEEWSGAL